MPPEQSISARLAEGVPLQGTGWRVKSFVRKHHRLTQSQGAPLSADVNLGIPESVQSDTASILPRKLSSSGATHVENRKSCSDAIFWRKTLLTLVSQLQNVVALSSCEAETAILLQSQETMGIRCLIESL